MFEAVKDKKITIEKVVEKMCHNPARLFQIKKRGFIKKGYYADLVLIDTKAITKVDKSNILYKCEWSPFQGTTFHSKITHTFVNGNLVYNHGEFNNIMKGMQLTFNR